MSPASKRKEPPIATAPARKKQWRTPKKGQPLNQALTINPGDAGIWATCDMHKEGKATVELRDLFEDYAVKMFGEDSLNVDPDDSSANAHDDLSAGNDKDDCKGNEGHQKAPEQAAGVDIEAEIANELQDMRKSRTAKAGGKHQPLFQAVRIDVQCVLFFKTRLPVEPVSFVERICRDAKQGTAVRRSRCVKRLTPMSRMGKANWEGLEGVSREVLREVFHGEGHEGKKFAIRPTIRNHSTMKRDDVIKQIAQTVGSGHTVDLKHYEYLILVDIYRNVLGMSVVGGNYEDLKRFNLAEIYDPTPQTHTGKAKATEVDAVAPDADKVENASPAMEHAAQDAADDEKPLATSGLVTGTLQSADGKPPVLDEIQSNPKEANT